MKKWLSMWVAAATLLSGVAAHAADALRLGVGLFQPDREKNDATYLPLAQYLSTKLGRAVELRTVDTWEGLAKSLANGETDLALMGPWGYVLANHVAGAQVVSTIEYDGKPEYFAIIVTHPDSGIKTMADLKGKKVAVTKGAGSHFLLLAALAKAGLSFKDISPAYLTPADGRTAFIGGNVDAWVAWDPFLTSAQRQSNARVLSDGSNGLASYKRYYLSSAAFADRRSDVLNAIFAKLDETGKWVKAHPKEAAAQLAGLWGIDAATVEEANSHRSYKVGVVTAPGLSEQQRIADAFFTVGLLPVKVDAGAAKIWTPKRD